MPQIVFEGIDGMGKTTRARKLADFLNVPYLYFPRPKGREQHTDEWIRYAFKLMRKYSTQIKDFVLDRSVISAVVYNLDYYNQYKEALKTVLDMGYHVIFLMPESDRYADHLYINRYWEVIQILKDYNKDLVKVEKGERYEKPDVLIPYNKD